MLVKHCHICGNPASIFLTQIADGKLTELAFCKKCAQEKGMFDPRKLMMAERFFPPEIGGDVESFIKRMLESSYMEEAEDAVLSSLPDMLTECPHCHYPLDRYQQTGLLGCSECYRAFAAELQPLVKGSDTEPPPHPTVEADYLNSPTLERGRLEVLLHDAILSENYEEAARLRDRIRSLPES